MRLLVNHQLFLIAIQAKNINYELILIPIQAKSISLEQICYKRSQVIAVTSLHCLVFSTSKNKDLRQILKKCYKCSVTLKFLRTSNLFFPSNLFKINNSIELRSTNQINEISAPWWLKTENNWVNYKKQIHFCVNLLRKFKIEYLLNAKDLSGNRNLW